MRGFPPIQVALLVLGFCLAAIPLARLTGKTPGASTSAAGKNPESPAETGSPPVPAIVVVRFAHVPERLVVRQGDRELIVLPAGVSSPFEANVRIDSGRDAADFIVESRWPAGTPETAVGLEVSPEGIETRSQTHWSIDESMEQVFHLSW